MISKEVKIAKQVMEAVDELPEWQQALTDTPVLKQRAEALAKCVDDIRTGKIEGDWEDEFWAALEMYSVVRDTLAMLHGMSVMHALQRAQENPAELAAYMYRKLSA